jgi:phosphatidylserine decarboxylase
VTRWSSPRWRAVSEGWAVLCALVLVARTLPRWPRLLVLSLAAAVAWALRDPERETHPQPAVALAPADGRVLFIRSTWDAYFQRDMLEIGIFLALWNVHIQRAPLSGTVLARQRTSGGYHSALDPTSAEANQRVTTYLDADHGPCVVIQIAGLVARRIVTWAEVGARLEAGQRLGMIKFGSQTSLRLPANARPLIEVGQHVHAGLTPVASLLA